jgi:hypothetical protein
MIFPPNIIRVIKLRRMRWAGNVAYVGESTGVYRILVGDLRERDRLGDPGVNGIIILRWIIRKWDGGYELDLSDSGKGSDDTCNCGNEPSASIKCGKFLDNLRTV